MRERDSNPEQGARNFGENFGGEVMARPNVITKESVFAFLNANAEQGKQTPTLEGLREALGGGSYSTLSALVKEWKNSEVTSGVKITLPFDRMKTAELTELLQAVFAQFKPLIEADVERYRKNIDYQLQIAEIDKQTLLDDNARLEEENEAQKKRFAAELEKQKKAYAAEVENLAKIFSEQAQKAGEERQVLCAILDQAKKQIEELTQKLEAAEREAAASETSSGTKKKAARKARAEAKKGEAEPVEDTESGDLFEGHKE
jgi:DNA repair exonuclease SbcCD ATPase subunit